MKKLTEAETIMCAAAILSTGAEPKDVFIEPRKPNPDDCPKCGFGLSDEWPDGRRVCDDCDHEWFKASDSSANNDKQNTPASGLHEPNCSGFIGNSGFLLGDKVSVHRPPIRDLEYIGVVVGVSPFCAYWVKVKDEKSGKTYGWHYENLLLIDRSSSGAHPPRTNTERQRITIPLH
jgi:hypothetical protein